MLYIKRNNFTRGIGPTDWELCLIVVATVDGFSCGLLLFGCLRIAGHQFEQFHLVVILLDCTLVAGGMLLDCFLWFLALRLIRLMCGGLKLSHLVQRERQFGGWLTVIKGAKWVWMWVYFLRPWFTIWESYCCCRWKLINNEWLKRKLFFLKIMFFLSCCFIEGFKNLVSHPTLEPLGPTNHHSTCVSISLSCTKIIK